MDKHHSAILRSIEQYRELFRITKQIGDDINNLDTISIKKYLDELNILLTEAKKTDKIINESDLLSLSAECKLSFEERYTLMNDFMQLNDEVAAMIHAKNAVLKSEYQKIRQGRTGLKGYQNNIPESHRIINSSA